MQGAQHIEHWPLNWEKVKKHGLKATLIPLATLDQYLRRRSMVSMLIRWPSLSACMVSLDLSGPHQISKELQLPDTMDIVTGETWEETDLHTPVLSHLWPYPETCTVSRSQQSMCNLSSSHPGEQHLLLGSDLETVLKTSLHLAQSVAWWRLYIWQRALTYHIWNGE